MKPKLFTGRRAPASHGAESLPISAPLGREYIDAEIEDLDDGAYRCVLTSLVPTENGVLVASREAFDRLPTLAADKALRLVIADLYALVKDHRISPDDATMMVFELQAAIAWEVEKLRQPNLEFRTKILEPGESQRVTVKVPVPGRITEARLRSSITCEEGQSSGWMLEQITIGRYAQMCCAGAIPIEMLLRQMLVLSTMRSGDPVTVSILLHSGGPRGRLRLRLYYQTLPEYDPRNPRILDLN